VTPKPDAELVALARCGDKAAFGYLIERHQAMVHQLTRKIVGEPYLAQELAQETLLQAYLSLPDLRDAARFRSWLYGIAINVCKSHLRSQKIDYLSLESLMGGMYIDAAGWVDAPPDPQAVAEARDLQARILTAINTLSPKNRTATLLFYYDQLSVAEIATLVGVSVTAIKGRLHKSRQHLKAQLLAQDGQPDNTRSRIERSQTMIEVKVADVALKMQEGSDPPQLQHIVTLYDEVGKRLLFIWVGPEQAEHMMIHLNEVKVPRPLTYTLMANLLAVTGAELEAVQVDTLQENTYIATIRLRVGETTQTVDARPSDAINLALRLKKPIYVSETVLGEHGVDISETGKVPTGRGLALLKQYREQNKWFDSRFTLHARGALSHAAQQAYRLKHTQTGTGHLLLGLLAHGLASDLLAEKESFKAPASSKDDLRERVLATLGSGDYGGPFDKPNQSERLKRVIDLAIEEAEQLGIAYIGTEHLLLGLFSEGTGMAAEILGELTTLDLPSLRGRVKAAQANEEDKRQKEATTRQELVDFVLAVVEK
jgi:RNA polymerase sigma factor (sigma-70 family)